MFVKGTADFVALNFYSATVVEHDAELANDPSTVWNYDTDQEIKKTRKPHWIEGNLSPYVTESGPGGFRIAECCWIPDSKVLDPEFRVLDSGFLSLKFCGFRIPKLKLSWIPDSKA